MPDNEVTLYDLFDALIDRVPWRTETEVRQYKELIVKLRDINLFGYMAERISVERQFDDEAHRQHTNRGTVYDTVRQRRY